METRNFSKKRVAADAAPIARKRVAADSAPIARKRQAISPITQKTRDFILFQMCKEVDCIQEGSVAGDRFRARQAVLDKYKNHPDRQWITDKMFMNYRGRKYKRILFGDTPETIMVDNVDDGVSDLTNPFSTNEEVGSFESTEIIDISSNPLPTNEEVETFESTESQIDLSTIAETLLCLKKPGRPKGSTAVSLREQKNGIVRCKNFLATQLSLVKPKTPKKQIPSSVVKELLEKAKEKFNLDDLEVQKCLKAGRSRIYRPGRNIVCEHRGTKSPILCLDPVVVDLCVQLAAMRQPLRATHLISLVNSLLSGTDAAKLLEEFKLKHCQFSSIPKDSVGSAWYRAFMKRNPQLVTKKCILFDNKRAEWATYDNIEKMYKEVYKLLVEKKLAQEYPEENYLDENGIPTGDESKAVGFRTKYKLIRPDMFFFADEVGDNTSQKNDGCRNERVIAESSQAAQTNADTSSDNHFTTFVITAADGVPVCCAILLESSGENAETPVEVVMGLQPWVKPIGTLNTHIRENSGGLDKVWPLGPICTYKGVEIPSYVTCCKSACMSSEILTDILRHVDSYVHFDRSECSPFLLIDGHQSRFGLDFLRYIREPEHQWTVCLGVPYATHLWQVGDSSEQNGSFKMALKEAKRKILEHKFQFRLPLKILKTDVVPLVHQAFLKSFARKETNVKAASDRGWRYLNYRLLANPLIAERPKESTSVIAAVEKAQMNNIHPLSLEDLNTEDGTARASLDRLIEAEIRKRARKDGIEKSAETDEDRAKAIMEGHKKLTSGTMFRAGYSNLEQAYDVVVRVTAEKEHAIKAQQERRESEEHDLKLKIEEVRHRNLTPEQWGTKELKLMCTWFKRPKDAALPTRKVDLLLRYKATCHRVEYERNRKKDSEPEVGKESTPQNPMQLAVPETATTPNND
jgi:hypothetical protein